MPFTITPLASALLLLMFTFLQAGLVSASEDSKEELTGQPEQNETTKPVKEETVKRELSAGEDPLVLDNKKREDQKGFWRKEHTELNPYGSVRLHYAGREGDYGFDDAGSRAGLAAELQFRPRFWILGRAEFGFNFYDAIDNLLGGEGEESEGVSTRLAYVGLEGDSNTFLYGKNWSSYYQVSGMTDRFSTFGADASGTFNALGDGGASGTGRADDVLQARFSVNALPDDWNLKPFKLHLQVQPGEPIPQVSGVDYKHAIGISAVLESKSENVVGIAYNQAFVDDEDLSITRGKGIDGDARALVIGTRRFADSYYLATSFSLLENHETTNEGTYFDGWGWEAFGSWNVHKKWWLLGGWNMLEPSSDQIQVGSYRLRYGVLGFRYTVDDFRRMVYVELRLDDSRDSEGNNLDNIYAVGIRWDFP